MVKKKRLDGEEEEGAEDELKANPVDATVEISGAEERGGRRKLKSPSDLLSESVNFITDTLL